MRVGIGADWHNGNVGPFGGEVTGSLNVRCRQTIEVGHAAVDGTELDVLVLAGDIFDTCRPLPQMVDEVGKVLRKVKEVHAVLGNHDQHSTTPGDNALKVLELLGNVTVHETPARVDRLGLVLVPYGYDHRDVGGLVLPGDVVVAHHGIRDDAMASWTRDKGVPVDDLVEFLEATGASHYLAGDWHLRQSWGGGRVQQIGALCPKDWSNPGFDGYGTILTYDPDAPMRLLPGTAIAARVIERRVIPGPRFIKSSSPTDALDHPACRWLYVKTAYPRSAREFPPGAIIDDSVQAVTAEGEARSAAEVVTGDDETHEAAVTNYVDQDASIRPEIKAEVARRALGHLV